MDKVNDEYVKSFDQTVGRFLTYRIARLQSKLNAQAARVLQDAAGLSLIQWRIITLVVGYDGATATELTQISSIDKGLFSRKVKTLIEDGLVQSRTDPADNRVQHLHITEEGREIYERVFPIMRERQEAFRSGLGEENTDRLLELLVQLENLL